MKPFNGAGITTALARLSGEMLCSKVYPVYPVYQSVRALIPRKLVPE